MKYLLLLLCSLSYSLNSLPSKLQIQWDWNPILEQLELQSAEGNLIYSPLSSVLSFNSSSYPNNLTLQRNDNGLHLDSNWTPWLDSLYSGEVLWKNGLFEAIPNQHFQKLSITPKKNGSIVDLSLSKKFRFETFWNRPYFIIRFDDMDLEKQDLSQKFTKGQIRRILSTQEENSAQITFEVNHLVDKIDVSQKDNNVQLLFRRPLKKTKPKQIVKSTKNSLKTIIIDAGHGGKDVGALGKKNNEKTITLSVAKELSKQLKAKGFKVKLTRDNDTFVSLKKRPKLASDWEGDLFISLHCNSIGGSEKKRKATKGFKIFILREAKSEADKTIARRENQFISESKNDKKSHISPVEWILLEHQLNLYTKESERFTSFVVKDMEKHNHKHGSGASQAGFYVLVGAYMPAVLVEMGFISNPEEEKYLASRKGQKEIATSLTKSILKYQKALNQ